MQTAEVHDAVDGCLRRRIRDGVRGGEVGPLEPLPLRHRVDEVVQHVDVDGRRGERLGIRRTALDDLDVVPPVERRESRRVAHEHPHPVARREKPGHEPTADVACRAEHERARRRAVRARLGAQGLFAPRGGRQLGHAASVRRSARSGAGLAPGRRAR